MLRAILLSTDDGLLLQRRIGRRVPEERLNVLAYADIFVLLSSPAESTQRHLDTLAEVAETLAS